MRLHIVRLFAAASLALTAAPQAQPILSYRPHPTSSLLEFLAPWSGPNAAAFNPARLAGSKYGSGFVGRYQSLSDKVPITFVQGAAALPLGFAVGAGYLWKGEAIDNSNSYYEQAELFPMLSWRLPVPLAGGVVDAGLGFPTYYFNAFNAVKSHGTSLDVGLQWTGIAGNFGRLQAGAAAQDLIPVRLKLPAPNTETFRLQYPRFEGSADWISPKERWDLFLLIGFQTPRDRSQGGVDQDGFYKAFGVEFLPLPFLGIKWEVTRYGSAQPIGLLVHLKPLTGMNVNLETDIYHEKFLHPPLPDFLVGEKTEEGLGYLVAFSAGIDY